MADDMMSQDTGFIPPQVLLPQGTFIGKDSETIKYRLNADDLISRIEHNLKGEHWVTEQITDNDGHPIYDKRGMPVMIEHYKKVGIAKCNDYGAKALAGLVDMFVGKNTFLSDLTKEEINDICRQLGHALIYVIEDRYDDYGIDAKDMLQIVEPIVRLVFISLKRAEQGRERDAISQIHTINEHTMTGGSQQGRSILNPFNWGKGGQ